MLDYLDIQENSDLVRDTGSKALVNTNIAAYEAAVKRANIAKKQKNDIRDAIRDINILKNEMKEIKSLLLKMTESNHYGNS